MENENKHFTIRASIMAALVAVVALVGYTITEAQTVDCTYTQQSVAMTVTAGQTQTATFRVSATGTACSTDSVSVQLWDTSSLTTWPSWCTPTNTPIGLTSGSSADIVFTCTPPATGYPTYDPLIRLLRGGSVVNTATFDLTINPPATVPCTGLNLSVTPSSFTKGVQTDSITLNYSCASPTNGHIELAALHLCRPNGTCVENNYYLGYVGQNSSGTFLIPSNLSFYDVSGSYLVRSCLHQSPVPNTYSSGTCGGSTNSTSLNVTVSSTTTTLIQCANPSHFQCPAVGNYAAGCYSICPTASTPGLSCGGTGQIGCWNGSTPYCHTGTFCPASTTGGVTQASCTGTVNPIYCPAIGSYQAGCYITCPTATTPGTWSGGTSTTTACTTGQISCPNSSGGGSYCYTGTVCPASTTSPTSCPAGQVLCASTPPATGNYCYTGTTCPAPTVTPCVAPQVWCPTVGTSPAGCYATCPTTTPTPTTCPSGQMICYPSNGGAGYCAATCPPATPTPPPGACAVGQTCPSTSWCDQGQRCYTTTSDIKCVAWNQTCESAGAKSCSPSDTNCVESGGTGSGDSKWCSGSSSKCYKKASTTKEFLCVANPVSSTTAGAGAVGQAACPAGYTHCSPGDTNCLDIGEKSTNSNAWCWSGTKCSFTDGSVSCVSWGESCPVGGKLCPTGDTRCGEPGGTTSIDGWCAGNALQLYSNEGIKLYCHPRTNAQMMDPNWYPTVPAGFRFCRSTDLYCKEPGQKRSTSEWCAWQPYMDYATTAATTMPLQQTVCPSVPGYTPPDAPTPPTTCPAGQKLCEAKPGKGGIPPYPGGCMPENTICPGEGPIICPMITAMMPIYCPPGMRRTSRTSTDGCIVDECVPDQTQAVCTLTTVKDCRSPTWKWDSASKGYVQSDESPYYGGPGPGGSYPTTVSTLCNFHPLELEWKNMLGRKYDPVVYGCWYRPPWSKSDPWKEFNEKTGKLESCFPKPMPAYISQTPEIEFWAMCEQVPADYEDIFLTEQKAFYQMHLLWKKTGSEDNDRLLQCPQGASMCQSKCVALKKKWCSQNPDFNVIGDSGGVCVEANEKCPSADSTHEADHMMYVGRLGEEKYFWTEKEGFRDEAGNKVYKTHALAKTGGHYHWFKSEFCTLATAQACFPPTGDVKSFSTSCEIPPTWTEDLSLCKAEPRADLRKVLSETLSGIGFMCKEASREVFLVTGLTKEKREAIQKELKTCFSEVEAFHKKVKGTSDSALQGLHTEVKAFEEAMRKRLESIFGGFEGNRMCTEAEFALENMTRGLKESIEHMSDENPKEAEALGELAEELEALLDIVRNSGGDQGVCERAFERRMEIEARIREIFESLHDERAEDFVLRECRMALDGIRDMKDRLEDKDIEDPLFEDLLEGAEDYAKECVDLAKDGKREEARDFMESLRAKFEGPFMALCRKYDVCPFEGRDREREDRDRLEDLLRHRIDFDALVEKAVTKVLEKLQDKLVGLEKAISSQIEAVATRLATIAEDIEKYKVDPAKIAQATANLEAIKEDVQSQVMKAKEEILAVLAQATEDAEKSRLRASIKDAAFKALECLSVANWMSDTAAAQAKELAENLHAGIQVGDLTQEEVDKVFAKCGELRRSDLEQAYEDGKVVYRDVPTEEWYAVSCVRANEEGIILGRKEGEFVPSSNTKRAEVLAMANRMFGIPEGVRDRLQSDSCVGVPEWAFGLVNGALSHVDGFSCIPDFFWKEDASRTEVAQIFTRVGAGKIPAIGDIEDLKTFKDYDEIAKLPVEEQQALATFVASGIYKGTPEGYLKPNAPIIRAELAGTVDRLGNIYGTIGPQ